MPSPVAVHALVAVADADLAARVEASLLTAVPVVVRRCEDAAGIAAELHDRSFDLVIADVDADGFDDPLMLRLARDTQPTALRIGLLGRPRDEAALAALAHQIVLPRDVDGIGVQIRSALIRQRAIESPVVLSQIANCSVLPGVPSVLAELSVVLGDPECSVADLADVVRTDPELVARVLQLTNSAFFGRRTPTADVATAVAWLGAPAVRGLVVHLEILRAFAKDVPKIVSDLAEDLRAHGRDTANWARELVPDDPEAWTVGLLHDLGKLVLAANDPDGWATVEALMAAGRSSAEAERELFGCDHAAVGACLLAAWGLPVGVVDAVAGHHAPAELGPELHLAGTVHLADALVHGVATSVDREWLAQANLTDWFDQWWVAAHP